MQSDNINLRGSIIALQISCFCVWGFSSSANVESTTDLLVLSNPNQSYRKSAVQWCYCERSLMYHIHCMCRSRQSFRQTFSQTFPTVPFGGIRPSICEIKSSLRCFNTFPTKRRERVGELVLPLNFWNSFNTSKLKSKSISGQWLWLSWKSGRFQYQRSAVRIHALSRFYNQRIYC